MPELGLELEFELGFDALSSVATGTVASAGAAGVSDATAAGDATVLEGAVAIVEPVLEPLAVALLSSASSLCAAINRSKYSCLAFEACASCVSRNVAHSSCIPRRWRTNICLAQSNTG